jgi:hypothetical protein
LNLDLNSFIDKRRKEKERLCALQDIEMFRLFQFLSLNKFRRVQQDAEGFKIVLSRHNSGRSFGKASGSRACQALSHKGASLSHIHGREN